MTISSVSPATTSVASAADRATDAALAKATAKLTADKKAQASADVIRADQLTVTKDTKAAQKADAAAKTSESKVSLTA